MKRVGIAVLAVSLASCASHPDKIDSAYVSPLKYSKYDCDQISTEMDYVGQRTTKLYQKLESEREADNWQMGVGLVLFWPALFFLEGGDGPEAAEYSQLKGEFEALRKTSVEKKCGLETKQSPEEILRQEEADKKGEAKSEATQEGAKYTKFVQEIAETSQCQEGVSLIEVKNTSESYMLLCDKGQTMTVVCTENGCANEEIVKEAQEADEMSGGSTAEPVKAREDDKNSGDATAIPVETVGTEDKLRDLKKLFDENLISEEVYKERQTLILKEQQ